MRLFIAEKPSLGRAIGEVLGKGTYRDGFIEIGDDVVTWCFGHMLELEEPDGYNASWKSWNMVNLPIIPTEFKYKERADVKKQLGIIEELLQKASLVVNAGDPDREGQLLVDEVIEYYKYKGATLRIWLNSLDAKSVQKALASMEDNNKFRGLRNSAQGRSHADWLVGLNLTRAMTNLGKYYGKEERAILSIGRVQTPTLALIVERDKAIDSFKSKAFYAIHALLSFGGKDFLTKYIPQETDKLDGEGRIISKSFAEKLGASLKSPFIVKSKITEGKTKYPPLPFSLSSLQKEASAKLGFSAQDVLNLAQALYEKKLTSYPRSDCNYLPEEQFEDGKKILSSLVSDIAKNANPSLKSKAWDTSKVTAHHAIIPTGNKAYGLKKEEEDLYTLISQNYALQFHEPMKYEETKLVLEFENTNWQANGKIIISAGFTKYLGNITEEDQSDDHVLLPSNIKEGDICDFVKAQVVSKKTSAPKRFTEGTLIEAMANIHRYIDDVDAKKTLKENEGIGTEATRANIIETLKRRGFIEVQKKALVSTKQGKELIDICPVAIKNPVLTASWETKLSQIESNTCSLEEFLSGQKDFVKEHIGLIRREIDAKRQAHFASLPKCKICGKHMFEHKGIGRDNKPYHFYGCSGYKDGCKYTYNIVDSESKIS